MKYLIMFQGGVETQEYFSLEMARTFEQNGYTIYWFNLIFCKESAAKLKNFYCDKVNAGTFQAFTFNFSGIAGEEGLYEADGTNFWDAAGIPVYNMVVDHPLYYHKYMKYSPKRYVQISIDRNHVRYLNRYFPEVNSNLTELSGFVPLGGTGLYERGTHGVSSAYLPYENRPIDVIFTGNYTRPETFEPYLDGMDADYKDFYHSLVEEACQNPDVLIEELAERRLKEEIGEPITDEQLASCMPNMMFVDLSVRFYYREKVIRELVDSGIQVHTFGAGWDKLACRHPENLIQAGNVDSQECLDRIAQSKISINVMPWFKDGAHDRIFNSMLNGAVCVSDDSVYLREIFTRNRQIEFYSLRNIQAIPEQVQSILSDPAKWGDMTEQAYAQCIKKHTWQQRVDEILKLMRADG